MIPILVGVAGLLLLALPCLGLALLAGNLPRLVTVTPVADLERALRRAWRLAGPVSLAMLLLGAGLVGWSLLELLA